MRKSLFVTKDIAHLYPDTSSVLRKSFKTDPVHQWFFQRDFDYYSEKLFHCMVDDMAIKNGKGSIRIVVDENDNVKSSSLWFDGSTPEWYEYMGLLPLSFTYPSAFYRLLYLEFVLEPVHKQIMGNRPHYYLLLIGTDPDYEGKGYGSQLMKEQLEIVDKEYKEVYLESSKEENIPFYEKFGFKLQQKIQKGSMPPLFAMKRDAKEKPKDIE